MLEREPQYSIEETLFEVPEASQTDTEAPDPASLGAKPFGEPRILRPERTQIEICTLSLDDRLPENHPARDVWTLVEKLDLSNYDNTIKSVHGGCGRPAVDRRILLAIWTYAYSEGIGSGRHIDRLCREHDAYKWLAGGVSLNYHTIDDFRTKYKEQIEELVTQLLAVIMQEGLMEVSRMAADGTKIQACAKDSRFHREGTIREKLKAAQEHVEAVNLESEQNTNISLRKEKARQRAARESSRKLEHALEQLEDIRSHKKKSDAPKARASITDPESRKMQLSKGAYGPGFNVQVATDMDTGIIIGTAVTQDNDDSKGLPVLVPEIEKNIGKVPPVLATDVKYANYAHLDYCDRENIQFYSPQAPEQDVLAKSSPGNRFLKENSKVDATSCELLCPANHKFKLRENVPPPPGTQSFSFHRRKDTCSGCPLADQCCPDGDWKKSASITVKTERTKKLLNEHKERYETDEAKELLKLRFQNELPNAALKKRMGLRQFHVQGLGRVRLELLLVVFAYNLLRWKSLRKMKGT